MSPLRCHMLCRHTCAVVCCCLSCCSALLPSCRHHMSRRVVSLSNIASLQCLLLIVPSWHCSSCLSSHAVMLRVAIMVCGAKQNLRQEKKKNSDLPLLLVLLSHCCVYCCSSLPPIVSPSPCCPSCHGCAAGAGAMGHYHRHAAGAAAGITVALLLVPVDHHGVEGAYTIY